MDEASLTRGPVLSPASGMGPSGGEFRHEDGTTSPPVVGPHGGSTGGGPPAGDIGPFGRQAAVWKVAMFGEVRVYEFREVLRLWLRGEGLRSIERLARMDRKTVRRYVAAA